MTVSVCIAVYNGLPYLKEQISSVLKDCSEDCIIYILDDCSNDGSFDYLCTIDDPRIILRKNDRNICSLAKKQRIKA